MHRVSWYATKRRRPEAHLVLVLLSLCSLAPTVTGCGKVLGPERMPVASVSGVVREGRRPVGGGWIEFIPVDGTIGNQRSARLHADGSYRGKRRCGRQKPRAHRARPHRITGNHPVGRQFRVSDPACDLTRGSRSRRRSICSTRRRDFKHPFPRSPPLCSRAHALKRGKS